MEAAVLLRIGVRLVPSVHQRTLQGGLESHFLFEEVGAAGELVPDGGGAVLGADLARAREHLPGHEPRKQRAHQRIERGLAVDEIVLVGAVGVALAIGVVLIDDDFLAGIEDPFGRAHRSGEDPLPRFVGDDELECIRTFRSGVLRMRVVDVVASAVGEHGVDQMRLDDGRAAVGPRKSAGVVARRFVLEVPADPAVFDVGIDQE